MNKKYIVRLSDEERGVGQEIVKRLMNNEGAEIVPSIDASLHQALPAGILSEARKEGSAREFGKVADWRGFECWGGPESYGVGLELSATAPGGLARPHGDACYSRARTSATRRRSTVRLNSLIQREFWQISRNQSHPLTRRSISVVRTPETVFRRPTPQASITRLLPRKRCRAFVREDIPKGL